MPKKKDYRVAVLGATGSVGRGIISLLHERQFPVSTLVPLASERSQGKSVSYGDASLPVQMVDSFDFQAMAMDLLFCAVEGHIAKRFVPQALEAGCWVIDKSSHFRMHENVPLIVPEVNGHLLNDLAQTQKLIASPNCVATPLALALHPIHQQNPIKRLVLSTYQSVSGAGKKAMDELFNQTRQILATMPVEKEIFNPQIAFNVIPQIGDLNLSGDSDEEQKIKEELQKLLQHPIAIAATCVRVPVFVGHSINIWVELEEECGIQDIKHALQKPPYLHLITRKDEHIAPLTPLDCAGEDQVWISRLRLDKTSHNAFSMWLCSDNLRKGAALNALHIAETLHRDGLF